MHSGHQRCSITSVPPTQQLDKTTSVLWQQYSAMNVLIVSIQKFIVWLHEVFEEKPSVMKHTETNTLNFDWVSGKMEKFGLAAQIFHNWQTHKILLFNPTQELQCEMGQRYYRPVRSWKKLQHTPVAHSQTRSGNRTSQLQASSDHAT